MRVAVVAGPDPGHAFPALALCLEFLAAGDDATLLTGTEWLDTARIAGVGAVELLGVPWVELSPHPLYRPSAGLPPVGSGLAPGTGLRGRLRDAVLRALSAR